ncbi:unnamed protein product [Closterium sp. Naga37s-1]|nr:unnamed protein product [Closterium sp. Naga37s-1]
MPVSIGDEYYSYSPRPFVEASAAIAPPALSSTAPAAVGMSPLPAPRSAPSSVTQAGPVLAPATAPVPVVALMSASAAGPDHVPASSPAPALALAYAPAPAPGMAAASDPAHPPALAPMVPSVPVGMSAPLPVVAASSAADGAASVPPPTVATADPTYRPPPATSLGLSSAEVQSARASPLVTPTSLPAAAPAPPPTVQAGPFPAPLAPIPPAQRHPSPGRRQHRPHSPVLRDERETSRRRHDSHRHRVVSDALRDKRNGRASLSNSPRVAPAPVSLPPAAPYALAPPLPSSAAPPPRAPVASVAAPGNRLRMPWVPPVAGMEFVTAGGGPVTPQYPSLLHMAPASSAADPPVQSLVGPSPSADVPDVTLGQLWRLSAGLWAVHLIQVYCHAALSRGVPLEGGPLDECSDAADWLAELLAPVLAAPARGGVAGVGQLGTELRGLRRVMRAATAVDLIGATTVVVRELHCSLTGLLAVLDADQM